MSLKSRILEKATNCPRKSLKLQVGKVLTILHATVVYLVCICSIYSRALFKIHYLNLKSYFNHLNVLLKTNLSLPSHTWQTYY